MKDHIQALKDITSTLIEKSSEQEKFDNRKDILIEILTTLNFLDTERQSVERLLNILQNYTGVNSIGLRLKNGSDFPYYAVRGFSNEFVAKENSLHCQDRIFSGDADTLECMCGYVVSGVNKKDYPFFTDFGSFYTVDASGLVEGKYGSLPIDIKIRGECIRSGYATVVVIPLKCKSDTIVGLLQFNDQKKDAVSLDTVKFFEGIGISIGTALSRIRLLENLKKRCMYQHDRSYEDNELQSVGTST
jgi:transcriptional regulator with GAF, ATPase, and Fis domain